VSIGDSNAPSVAQEALKLCGVYVGNIATEPDNDNRRRIGAAIEVSGRTVSQFVNGSTEGWPRWGEAARAWLDALPAAAPSPDLQRPLFTTGSPNDDGT
jgi:hypothetical protein